MCRSGTGRYRWIARPGADPIATRPNGLGRHARRLASVPGGRIPVASRVPAGEPIATNGPPRQPSELEPPSPLRSGRSPSPPVPVRPTSERSRAPATATRRLCRPRSRCVREGSRTARPGRHRPTRTRVARHFRGFPPRRRADSVDRRCYSTSPACRERSRGRYRDVSGSPIASPARSRVVEEDRPRPGTVSARTAVLGARDAPLPAGARAAVAGPLRPKAEPVSLHPSPATARPSGRRSARNPRWPPRPGSVRERSAV